MANELKVLKTRSKTLRDIVGQLSELSYCLGSLLFYGDSQRVKVSLVTWLIFAVRKYGLPNLPGCDKKPERQSLKSQALPDILVDTFDLIVFGFSLYLIVSENGFLLIHTLVVNIDFGIGVLLVDSALEKHRQEQVEYMGVSFSVFLFVPQDVGLDPPVLTQVDHQLLQETLVVLEQHLGVEDVEVGQVVCHFLVLPVLLFHIQQLEMSESEDLKDSVTVTVSETVTETPNVSPPDSNVKKFVESVNPTGIFSSGYNSLKTYIFKKDTYINQTRKTFNRIYDQIPVDIADFKANYVHKLGDQKVRIVITSLISIPLWLAFNRSNPLLFRARNLAFIFTGVGVFFCPELLNPFLQGSHAKKS